MRLMLFKPLFLLAPERTNSSRFACLLQKAPLCSPHTVFKQRRRRKKKHTKADTSGRIFLHNNSLKMQLLFASNYVEIIALAGVVIFFFFSFSHTHNTPTNVSLTGSRRTLAKGFKAALASECALKVILTGGRISHDGRDFLLFFSFSRAPVRQCSFQSGNSHGGGVGEAAL